RARAESNATLAPLGAQTGSTKPAPKLRRPAAVSRVSGAGLEPSDFIIQTFGARFVFPASLPSRARVATNASFVPSGDQAGMVLATPPAVSLVRAVAPEPSALMTQTLAAGFAESLPSKARADPNAILVPSGDQTGNALFALLAVSRVSGVAPEPSDLITQMFFVVLVLAASLPSRARAETNAILVPSGDQAGLVLSASSAVILVSGVAPEPS